MSCRRARWVHSMLILGTLIFLRLIGLCLQALYCVSVSADTGASDGDGSADGSGSGSGDGSARELRLIADLRVVCFSGTHIGAAVVSFIVIIVVGFLFPARAIWSLWHAFHGSFRRVLPDATVLPGPSLHPDHWVRTSVVCESVCLYVCWAVVCGLRSGHYVDCDHHCGCDCVALANMSPACALCAVRADG